MGLKAVLPRGRMARLTPPQSIFFLTRGDRDVHPLCSSSVVYAQAATSSNSGKGRHCQWLFREGTAPHLCKAPLPALARIVKPAISAAARFADSLHPAPRWHCPVTYRQSAQKPTTRQPLSGRLQRNNARRVLARLRTHGVGKRNHGLRVRAKARERSYQLFRSIQSAAHLLAHRPTPPELDLRSLRKRPAY